MNDDVKENSENELEKEEIKDELQSNLKLATKTKQCTKVYA